MEPVAEKWRAFGFETKEIDGHKHKEIFEAVEWAREAKSAPRIIIAHTVKGKGVSFMENNNHFHGVANTKDETARALKELGENDAEINRILEMIK
jgi:transketolase